MSPDSTNARIVGVGADPRLELVGAIAQARRLYLHLRAGGELKPSDIGHLIKRMESAAEAMSNER